MTDYESMCCFGGEKEWCLETESEKLIKTEALGWEGTVRLQVCSCSSSSNPKPGETIIQSELALK